MVQWQVTNIFKALSARKKFIPDIPEAVWQHPLYFFAFGFGSGAIPFAPGTFGTLMAIPFYLCMQSFSLPIYLLFTLIFTIFSALACERVSRDIHFHDHPGMCIDEFPGFFVTMIHAPHGWGWVLLGFLLFRLFDIVKPWPISWIDKNIHGGFGMVLDDVVAGVFALVVMQVVRWV